MSTVGNVTIRRLRAPDAALFREVRLEALRLEPDSFAASYEVEGSKPLEFFAERLENSEVLGAFRGAKLLGVVGLFIQDGPKRAHKATVWTMYVRPEVRGAGIGRRLVEAIIAAASRRVEILQLVVEAGNEPARRLYSSLGFLEYGLERKAMKVGDRYFDDMLMAKELTPEPR